MTPADADSIVYLHEECLMPPPEIAKRLHVAYSRVMVVLAAFYAGRRAEQEAVRLMEMHPTRRRVLHVEAGSGPLPEHTTDTPARRAA